MPHGGKRVGAGRPKGTSKQRIARNEIAAIKNTMHLPKTGKGKPALEVLQDLLDEALSITEHFAPTPGNTHADHDRHERFLIFARDTAKELAKYQSPQLRSIAIAPAMPPAKTRRFTLHVFDSGRLLDVTPPVTPVTRGNGSMTADRPRSFLPPHRLLISSRSACTAFSRRAPIAVAPRPCRVAITLDEQTTAVAHGRTYARRPVFRGGANGGRSHRLESAADQLTVR
jgi:hypothetical protein